ncbi:MAG: RimK family alpha-L-glutamate ligase [Clostridia bacterium]|nr:RimK family alpha-L-glutamate ligase [Clostridia bacterium]
MKGLLVVNSFLQNKKFGDLYAYFSSAAKRMGISLDVRSSDQLFRPVGGGRRCRYGFVLFWDKDLFLARRFENEGVPVFNSSRAIALCDDKALTAEALACAGIRMPKTLIAPKTYGNIGYCDFAFLDRAELFLHYPMIIKHRFGSFGAQVYLAHNRREAEEICASCGGSEVLLEEFISNSCGRDLRVNVVGEEICGVMLRENKNDFRSNITLGGTMTPFDPPRAYRQIALRAARAVGADFAGVDVLFGKNGPVVCEVNASPHFKTTLQCTGVDLSEKILGYIAAKVQGK